MVTQHTKKKGSFFRALCGVCIVIALGCMGLVYYTTNPQMIVQGLAAKKQIKIGELRYSLNAFGMLQVGIASITPVRLEQWHSGTVVQLNATAQTLPFLAKIFKATATMATYADPQLMVPLIVMQEIHIKGKQSVVKEIKYDPARHTMTLDSLVRSIPADTMDPLTILMRFKKADLSKIKEFDYNLNTNQKNYSFKGTVKATSAMIKGYGHADLYTVKASIFRRDKNPYHKSGVEIVFLKDTENIPLLIKISASGAFLVARLYEISS